jgi:DNA-binding transcriptional ArsR family regulator
LIARLQLDGDLSVGTLAGPFEISLPAVMKHLQLLSAAGIVVRTKQGRVVTYRLTPQPLEAAAMWLDRHRSFWSDGLDRLAVRAAAKERKKRRARRS